MIGKDYLFEVLEKRWLTPTVFELVFKPNSRLKFEEGQFLSVYIPTTQVLPTTRGHRRELRRAYSFASSYLDTKQFGYRLCIKRVEGGPGSTYLSQLEVGSIFRGSAPFGDFCFVSRAEGAQTTNRVVFISTGTGIAPFKAMIGSERFHDNAPKEVLCLFGARTEEEILYQAEFEAQGVRYAAALSQPSDSWDGFKGRVTDYLRNLPSDWGWSETDFYLCGNGDMISECVRILKESRNVPESQIFAEEYFSVAAPLKKAA